MRMLPRWLWQLQGNQCEFYAVYGVRGEIFARRTTILFTYLETEAHASQVGLKSAGLPRSVHPHTGDYAAGDWT